MSALQGQVISLQREIIDKQADIGLINHKIAALQEARSFAVAAQDEASAIGRTLSYFALSGWAGNHADSFMRTVGSGGRASAAAQQLVARCEELIWQIDAKISGLEGACSALRASIAQDTRMLNQARSSLARRERDR